MRPSDSDQRMHGILVQLSLSHRGKKVNETEQVTPEEQLPE